MPNLQKMMLKLFTLLLFALACNAEVATKYKDLLVDKHNELRRKQGATNMNKLVWNDTLAKEADAWIARCDWKHEMKGRGENLAYNSKTDDIANIDDAFENWYNEINQYNYEGKKCDMSCYYTQLVWYNTREVGCAIRHCPEFYVMGRTVRNVWYFGCWYDPKGNNINEYPFLKGTPCSACLEGQTCDNGLCEGKGKEACVDKDENCEVLQAGGLCSSNKAYMGRHCRLSCGLCTGDAPEKCVDMNPDCPRYGTATCESNKSYMLPNCRKTCGFC